LIFDHELIKGRLNWKKEAWILELSMLIVKPATTLRKELGSTHLPTLLLHRDVKAI